MAYFERESSRLNSSAPFDPSILFRVARRRNPRRSILIVSNVLAKHVPVDGRIALAAGRLLALQIATTPGARSLGEDAARALTDPAAAARSARAVPALSDTTVFGFCETAVGLGACVADTLRASYFHSTRHPRPGQRPLVAFSEPHSHAPTHVIAHHDPGALDTAGHLVLVDDELTTGTTALAVIEQVHATRPQQRYTVAALLDWRSPADVVRFRIQAEHLGVPIEVVSLHRGDRADLTAPDVTPLDHDSGGSRRGRVVEHRFADVAPATPFSADAVTHLEQAAAIAAALHGVGVNAIVGSEECIYLPTLIAAELGVTAQSTTLSPAVVATAPGYPIRSVVAFTSPFQGRPGYAYNVANHEQLALVTDGGAVPAHRAVAEALAAHTGGVVHLVLTGPAAAERASAIHLPGSVPSTYDPGDVEFAIADLGDADLEAPLAEREMRMQSGGHYSELLPIEYVPSAAYTELFDKMVAETAADVAHATAVLAERLVAETDALVIVSLARAGTPVGVLLTRYLRRVGIDVPHYTVSIIRDRGIDQQAIAHIRANHLDREIRFVDGWTGKGVIAKELARACATPGPAEGLDPTLAVVADPGHATRLYGTRDDLLIPSACLNSTVSGLVSRTVYRPDLTRGYHGAKFYGHLTAEDVSATFVDAIEAAFPTREDAVFAAAEIALAPGEVDWAGWASVERIGAEFGIGDVNRIKPGIGETLRVLLRRDPSRVLVFDTDDPALRPVLALAHEKRIPVTEYTAMTYRACGLIRSVADEPESN